MFYNFPNLSNPDASDLVDSSSRTEAGQPSIPGKCPSHCICTDSATPGNESSTSYVESGHFETNCTDIESGLASILNEVPKKITHLYLYRNVISEANPIKLPVLDRLRFLKLTLNTIKSIDDNAFSTIPQLHTL